MKVSVNRWRRRSRKEKEKVLRRGRLRCLKAVIEKQFGIGQFMIGISRIKQPSSMFFYLIKRSSEGRYLSSGSGLVVSAFSSDRVSALLD